MTAVTRTVVVPSVALTTRKFAILRGWRKFIRTYSLSS